ncbi:unnamed protein product, partial [Ectocarpus sp. 6 AP-2014]
HRRPREGRGRGGGFHVPAPCKNCGKAASVMKMRQEARTSVTAASSLHPRHLRPPCAPQARPKPLELSPMVPTYTRVRPPPSSLSFPFPSRCHPNKHNKH